MKGEGEKGMVMEIVGRGRKWNVVIVGDGGVGKRGVV